MRFSIRDLLWATVVVAMGLGWWVSYAALDAKRLAAVEQAQEFRAAVASTRKWHDEISYDLSFWNLSVKLPFDPSILDEPRVEP